MHLFNNVAVGLATVDLHRGIKVSSKYSHSMKVLPSLITLCYGFDMKWDKVDPKVKDLACRGPCLLGVLSIYGNSSLKHLVCEGKCIEMS